MKKILLLMVSCLLVVSLSACSKAAPADPESTNLPEQQVEPVQNQTQEQEQPQEIVEEPVEVSEFTTEGEYTLFGVSNQGLLVKSSDLETESQITLKEDNTGSMSFDGSVMDITQWTTDENKIIITMADGSQAPAKVHDGVLELDLYGNGSMILYFAQENADISGYEFLPLEEVQAKLAEN